MRLTGLSVLVFDIDDTLYLERDYIFSGFEAVGSHIRERFGQPSFAAACGNLFDAGVRGDTFNLALRACGIQDDVNVIADLVETYRQHTPQITLEEDAQAMLQHFAAHTTLAVISDGILASQRNKTRALNLTKWCSRVLLTGEWGTDYWKPHPRAYKEIQAEFGVAPQQCVYVGDNPTKDFLSCRKLGWKSVRVRRTGSLHEDHKVTKAEKADVEIRDLWSLPQTLESLFEPSTYTATIAE
ncbi:MAG: HAD family hydrolase [Planctomycetes bacterium]|nr:HAD family hydrolase [Planctomycetota bacterium]